uniref:Fatty acid synthase n=2 Tax=Lygus hesperus TaxID=30085 RepID=A0A0A9Y3U2_LYGHE
MDEKKVNVLKQSIDVALTGNVNVVIVSNLTYDKQLQTDILTHLKAGCFIISEEAQSREIPRSLELVAQFAFETKFLLLLRRAISNVDLTVMKLDENNFSWVEQVKDWLMKHGKSGRKLLLLSQAKRSSGIIGFFRCLRLEENGSSVRVMLVSEEVSLTDTSLKDQMQKGLAVNVLHKGIWGSYRHLKLTETETREDTKESEITTLTHSQHAYVNTLVRGDLSSLQWIQSQIFNTFSRGNGIDKELCTVYYAPLNFRDIMLATGKLPPDALPGNLADQDCVLGLEFAGRDSVGRRVIGIVEACGMATSIAADKGFLWDVPNEWSLEEASTVPIVYSTAYYALIVRGKLRKGESVLIHAGSGGVGMAAIAISLNMGCKVFTTVGTQSKKSFLLRTFDKLDSSMIGNSRDTSFEWMVLDHTAGKGVDVVLNSLAGEQLQSSVRCLADGGRFLEIGKVDLSNNSALGMAFFLKNTTFHGILLDALFQVSLDNPEKAEVSRLMQEGIRSGEVRPLPVTVFQNTQLEEAFRYMATGKHIGKVVLKIRQEEPEKIVEPRQEFVSAISKTYMDPGKSYIIVGGLGGFGLELADWLVTRGATKLVLTSRSGVTNGFQELSLRRWRARSIEVLISTTECTSQSGAKKIIASANQLGPVGGIYNLAGVLRDGLFNELSKESFEEVSAAKVRGSYWLDMCSRAACPQLDHFVGFSSVSCGRGNAGQTNYGYANSGLERICENRHDEGFPAESKI